MAFPEYIINLDVHYEISPQALSISLFNRLHINADLENYFRTDLSVSGKISSQLDYYFHVRNIFDRNIVLPSVWNSEGGIAQPGINATAGMRMTF